MLFFNNELKALFLYAYTLYYCLQNMNKLILTVLYNYFDHYYRFHLNLSEYIMKNVKDTFCIISKSLKSYDFLLLFPSLLPKFTHLLSKYILLIFIPQLFFVCFRFVLVNVNVIMLVHAIAFAFIT